MHLARVPALLLAALMLTACSTNPSTGRRQLILLPGPTVAAMGVEAMPQMMAEFGGPVESAPLRDYVSDIGFQLARHVEPEYGDIQWEFVTLDSEVVNAFALPGGKVFITRGLLERFDNEAQVAGVLGHEIGHVTARHVDERLSQALVAQLGLELLGAYSESALITEGAGMATQIGMLGFGRGQETESDLQGLKYMTAAGYDPHGMYEVLQVLLEASQGGARQPEFLATHPHPETRLKAIAAQLEGPYAFTRDNPAYGRYPERFRRGALPYLAP
ncbi:MAG: M48 family metallopeptidase [Phycisphaerales bacterium]|nr:M48 family metallopeptidase [Phycisphaerae bacterium]NNF42708.1 M48 family metallopeptidase [Phycisphaerales bacterium]NNM27051.1 M48 family metallopeptidase [Phycisphaerales bacterium]